MTLLARSLALATTLALLPGTALANPTTLATLQTVAVANDAGVAQSLAQPADPSSTQVTVMVSTPVSESMPACAAVPAPDLAAAPVVEVTPPPPTYTPLPYADRIYKDRKSGRGLLIGGLSLGGFAYLYTSLAGAVIFDKADSRTDPHERANRRAFGRALMIPGVGAALAIPKADTALQAWAAGMAMIAQATAVTMTLVGIHRLGRANRLERLQQRLSVGAMATSQQAHLSLSMRF